MTGSLPATLIQDTRAGWASRPEPSEIEMPRTLSRRALSALAALTFAALSVSEARAQISEISTTLPLGKAATLSIRAHSSGAVYLQLRDRYERVEGWFELGEIGPWASHAMLLLDQEAAYGLGAEWVSQRTHRVEVRTPVLISRSETGFQLDRQDTGAGTAYHIFASNREGTRRSLVRLSEEDAEQVIAAIRWAADQSRQLAQAAQVARSGDM